MAAGRQLNATNKERPKWMLVMQEKRPACFAPKAWVQYLDAAHTETLNDPGARMAMARGRLPNYCEDCVGGRWRQQMQEQGRCQPLPSASPAKESSDSPHQALPTK